MVYSSEVTKMEISAKPLERGRNWGVWICRTVIQVDLHENNNSFIKFHLRSCLVAAVQSFLGLCPIYIELDEEG
jgi:uncharacterized membrane protein